MAFGVNAERRQGQCMSPTKPRISTDPTAHRDLVLVSPPMRGKDVHVFQRSLNALATHYGFDWHHVIADGVYGRRTRQQAHFVAWCIGLVDDGRLDVIRHSGRITEEVQRLIRNPETRSKQDRLREEARRPKMAKLRRDHDEGLEASVAWMEEQARKHVNEQPPESNSGPFPIDECQAWYGGTHWPWCGCAVGYGIEKIALGGQKTGTWWPHAESIRLDAEGGRNGLADLNPHQIQRCDVVTFWPGGSDDDDHVGQAASAVDGAGNFESAEGNTSSALRDSDGGIFEIKTRHVSEVTCAARLTLAGI